MVTYHTDACGKILVTIKGREPTDLMNVKCRCSEWYDPPANQPFTCSAALIVAANMRVFTPAQQQWIWHERGTPGLSEEGLFVGLCMYYGLPNVPRLPRDIVWLLVQHIRARREYDQREVDSNRIWDRRTMQLWIAQVTGISLV
jgi:hypothetical protein